MISVEEALAHLFALAKPLESETVPLRRAYGRVLVAPVAAHRDQPPFSASAMDGYAVQDADVVAGSTLTVIGEAAAGHGFDGVVLPGQAVRIFTGAPLPQGADRIVIQEDVQRSGDVITLGDSLDKGSHVRPAGGDFAEGFRIEPPRLLSTADVALLAAMNAPEVRVTRKPRVAILSTGDELVMPGETPDADQIIVSNSFGLAAMIEALGAEARMLPIARDTKSSLETAFELAGDADLVVTIGGASVGDHDLVGEVAADLGMDRAFYKIAMRPGKPLMAGRMANGSMMMGLPGNPVSAMVCGHIFLAPVIKAMLGLPAEPAKTSRAILAAPCPANGPREHYMRGLLSSDGVTVFANQDSSLLTVLAAANVLVVRPPNAPAAQTGEEVQILHI